MTNMVSISTASLISLLVLSPAIALDGVPGRNEGAVPAEAPPTAKKNIDQYALEFMMLCNATSMSSTEYERCLNQRLNFSDTWMRCP